VSEKRRYTILAIIIIILGGIIAMPLGGFWQWVSQYNQPLTSSDLLSADEINSFLDVYNQFQETDFAKAENNENIYDRENLSSQVVRWFKNRGWNAERFFTREHQIKRLMTVAELSNNLDGIKHLQKAVAGINVQNVIAQQEEELKTFDYHQKDLDLIRGNLHHLNKYLKVQKP